MHSDKPVTASNENRRSAKPIMEKRRRARINASLTELKSLLMEVIKKEGARHNKMEKADILEMTVKHLRQMQKHQFTAPFDDPSISNKHQLGFSECAQEVSRYLSSTTGCDAELRVRLLDHLADSVSNNHGSSPKSPPMAVSPKTPSPPTHAYTHVTNPVTSNDRVSPRTPEIHRSLVAMDINNNVPAVIPAPQIQPAKVVSGVQVIPTKLSTGEIAFVLPASVVNNGQVPNYIVPVYNSQQTPVPAMTSFVTAPSVIQGATTAQIIPLSSPSCDAPVQACSVTSFAGNVSVVPYCTVSSSQVVTSSPNTSLLSETSPIRQPVLCRPLHEADGVRGSRHDVAGEPVWRPW